MARKKKEFNKKGAFQTRFREKFYKSDLTQEALANVLGVSRPTVIGWLEGKNLPDILSLEKIARYFEVSSDYLLGLSNTESPDVSVRAAVEYTGLTEEAVERLHIGLEDLKYDGVRLSEDKKSWNLGIASDLIQSQSFTDIVHHLGKVSEDAYAEKILQFLEAQHSNDGYKSKEKRDLVENTLLRVLEKTDQFWDGVMPMVLQWQDDYNLACTVLGKLIDIRKSLELHQFHASKALNSYIDEMVSECHIQAEQEFGAK